MNFDFSDQDDLDLEFAKTIGRDIAKINYPDSEIIETKVDDSLAVTPNGDIINIIIVDVVVLVNKKIDTISVTLKSTPKAYDND